MDRTDEPTVRPHVGRRKRAVPPVRYRTSLQRGPRVALATSTTPTVRVVVTCSHRKNRPAPQRFQMRSVTGVRMATRLRRWTTHLSTSTAPAIAALDLYAGEHWGIARRLAQTSASHRPRVELWVCSAGYGLIPVTAPIMPYAATFSPGSPDSVTGGASAWWAALADWEGPAGAPRRLTDLVTADPTGRLLVVLSGTYLRACRDDLLRAVEGLSDTEQLSILSAGSDPDPELSAFLLPADARLQAVVGGSLQALNIRIAQRLVAAGIVAHDAMHDELTKLLADQRPLRRYDRRRVTDTEVRHFIREQRAVNADASPTSLLRTFRETGNACEQGRFAAVFRAEVGGGQ